MGPSVCTSWALGNGRRRRREICGCSEERRGEDMSGWEEETKMRWKALTGEDDSLWWEPRTEKRGCFISEHFLLQRPSSCLGLELCSEVCRTLRILLEYRRSTLLTNAGSLLRQAMRTAAKISSLIHIFSVEAHEKQNLDVNLKWSQPVSPSK